MFKRNVQSAKILNGNMNQNCVIIENNPFKEIHKLMTNGDVAGAIHLLESQKKMVGSYHKYYPYYIIETKTVFGKEVPYSKPLSRMATEKYPPSIKVKFNFPNKYSDATSLEELLNYSYRTQKDIEINMIEIKKMLGDDEDPYQDEITSLGNLSEGKWFIKHKEFPTARPYRIILEGVNESFDYILLRATKITDNNEIFMSNFEQNNTLYVELVLKLKSNELDFNFKIDDTANKDKNIMLTYLKFIEQAGEGKKISVISLEDGILMASGKLNNINYSNAFSSIYQEISFLENILVIEKKYNKLINIPLEVYEDDFEAINYLATGIKDGIVRGNWSSHSFEVQLSENVGLWKNINDRPQHTVIKSKMDVIIFQEKFTVPNLTRKLISSTYDDIDKLKRKLEVLEAGDTIKIKLIPKDDDAYEDIFEF